jgi:hypothetical protein
MIPWNKGISRSIEEKEKISKKTREAMWKPEIRKKYLEGIKKRKWFPWNKGLTINNPKVRKSVENLQRGYKEKVKSNWNKGLTKETDERIKKLAEKVSEARKKLFQTERGKRLIEEHKKRLREGYFQKHKDEILKQAEILRQQGFQVLICDKKRPDIIARKNDKIYAVEVEIEKPNLYQKFDKWNDRTIFDDIHWIIIKRK